MAVPVVLHGARGSGRVMRLHVFLHMLLGLCGRLRLCGTLLVQHGFHGWQSCQTVGWLVSVKQQQLRFHVCRLFCHAQQLSADSLMRYAVKALPQLATYLCLAALAGRQLRTFAAHG